MEPKPKPTHICVICGKEFKHKSSATNLYCSMECSREGIKRANAKNPKPKKTHTCVICGKEFIHRSGKKNLCCSSACAVEYTRRARTKPKEYKICQFCGRTFEVKRRDLQNIYCSHECQIGEKKARKVILDEEKRANKRAAAAERARQAERPAAINQVKNTIKRILKEKQKDINRTSECPECGKIFEAERASNSGKQYCSEGCRRKHDNRRRDRRLEKCSVVDWSITLTKLYQRDHGFCQLCGEPVDFNADPNSDEYPSIDHIIPISKGGDHTWENVQLAHRGCNTKKLDKIPPGSEILEA